MREYYPNGWIKKSTDWQQSYFILRWKERNITAVFTWLSLFYLEEKSFISLKI